MDGYISLCSGSSGNCALVFSGNETLLIDAGANAKAIVAGLGFAGVDPRGLSGILITHAHRDHISALPVFSKKTSATIYASTETAEEIVRQCPALSDRLYTFRAGNAFAVGETGLQSFKTPHDSPGSVGYIIDTGKNKIGYATDIGYMSESILSRLRGLPLVVLESNHDIEMLKNGPYPYFLKKRILSQNGHLSNAECAESVVYLARGGTRKIVLAHLSEHNNTPRMAHSESVCALKAAGFTEEDGVELFVSPTRDNGRRHIL